MPKINQEEYEVLKPKLEEEYTHVGKSRDGKLQFLQGYIERDMKREEWSDGWGQTYMRPVNLFKFIQWEDSEPYSTAELIEEYEEHEFYDYVGWEYYESEETEVKKDIEWLEKEVIKISENWTEDIRGDFARGLDRAVSHTIKLIDQLDEPETLSEEWLDENKSSWAKLKIGGYYIPVDKLQNLLVPKQELPVIPKFVAEWIEERKSIADHWLEVFEGLAYEAELGTLSDEGHKVYEWILNNPDIYVDAYRLGYEAAEEQKYYARIKGWENVTTGSESFNWVYFKEKDTVGISKAVENKYQSVSFTKDDWNNLGINEDNADFVLVEEMEE